MVQHVYVIRVDGHLGDSWSPWLGGMSIRHQESGPPPYRLVQFLIDDPEPLLYYSEPIYRDPQCAAGTG